MKHTFFFQKLKVKQAKVFYFLYASCESSSYFQQSSYKFYMINNYKEKSTLYKTYFPAPIREPRTPTPRPANTIVTMNLSLGPLIQRGVLEGA